MSRRMRVAFAALVTLALAASAHAGQIRVNATGGFSFAPVNISVNVGDQVVWVGTGSSHSVTSGDANTGTPNGHFSFGSGLGGLTTGKSCAWKATTVRSEPYYCIPHLPSMIGNVDVVASGASVSDFRLVQVLFNGAAGTNAIELVNLGAAGDLGLYRLKIAGVAPKLTLDIGASHTLTVPGNGHVVIHFGSTGTNSTADLFYPAVTLPATGSATLYVPSTFGSDTLLTSTNTIIDYVAWGAGGQENEATAVSASLWTTGTAVTNVAAGHSIQFCGNPGQYGIAQWSEIGVPAFPSSGACVTPTMRTTWGRIKTLYR